MDKATGHSIATRQLDAAGAAEAMGFLFKIDGRAVKGDVFNFSANSVVLVITEHFISSCFKEKKMVKVVSNKFSQILFPKLGHKLNQGN